MTPHLDNPTSREVAAWFGWSVRHIERLLHADLDVWEAGSCLAELLGERFLSPAGSFRLSFYRHLANGDRYERVGQWSGGRDPNAEVRAERTLGLESSSEEISSARRIDAGKELFVPLETENAVLGFVLFRVENGPDLRSVAPEDLVFLGRVGGTTLLRLLDADRLSFAHRALGSTSRYLEESLELQRDAVLAIDPQGRVVAANEALEAVLGVLPADVIGQLVADAFPNQTAITLLTGAQMAAHHSGPFHRLLRLTIPVRKPATEADHAAVDSEAPGFATRAIEGSFVCVQLDLESAPGVLISLRDVRGAEGEEWFQDRENAGEALRGDALLRPVAALRGYLGLLRDELPMRGRVLELMHALDLQAEWLQVQLESQVLLEEFRSRESRWRDRPVSPWVLVDRALGRVRSRLEACGVRAIRNLPDDLPWIRVDVEKWVIALSHLVEWAVHRVDGPATLLIEEDPATRAEARLTICLRVDPVRGSGPALERRDAGIPHREFPYGLPLARSVVHHYGGTLLCEARPGHSPVVELTIPLDVSESVLRSA